MKTTNENTKQSLHTQLCDSIILFTGCETVDEKENALFGIEQDVIALTELTIKFPLIVEGYPI